VHQVGFSLKEHYPCLYIDRSVSQSYIQIIKTKIAVYFKIQAKYNMLWNFEIINVKAGGILSCQFGLRN